MSTPYSNIALQLSNVIGMQRLSELQHDVISDIDCRTDGPYSRKKKTTLHPPRGHCLRINARYPPSHETLRSCLWFNSDRPGLTFVPQIFFDCDFLVLKPERNSNLTREPS